jgi:crotonobetainyl-CoA:carnitine CoA-transferase CaiB-like acyl-CoA transferase
MNTPVPLVPLAGVRVLEAARILAGPFCGQLLGDLGAEVIKLERPGTGDDTRTWGPPFLGPLSAYFLSCNRNKRSVTLDVSQPAGQRIFATLAGQADVVIENFRTDSAAKLGLTPAALLAAHPRLIVCSISGYGRTGPWAERPGYDFAIQAESGLMSITGPSAGPPSKVGVAVADVLTGLYAATVILACLHARSHSGHGYHIDLALLDCAVAAQVNVAQAFLTSGTVPARQGNAHLQIVPYQLFATADGWLVLAVGNDGQWQHFCTAAGASALAADARFARNADRVRQRAELVPQLEQLLRTRTTAEWETALTAVNVPHARVWDYATLFQHEQAAARGLRVTVHDPAGQPVDLLGAPFHLNGQTPPLPTAPPTLGQDTESVLRSLAHCSDADLVAWRAAGVI